MINMAMRLVLPILLLFPEPAFAHVGEGATAGLGAGLLHPLLGADHLLAIVAVGVWAAAVGGRALVIWPGAFVAAMVTGAVLAMSGVGLPGVEAGILASVIVLGVVVGLALRVPALAGALMVGMFGLFHGHAHGSEAPLAASGLLYIVGFAATTAMLIAMSGLIFSVASRHGWRSRLIQALGGAGITGAGLALTLG